MSKSKKIKKKVKLLKKKIRKLKKTVRKTQQQLDYLRARNDRESQNILDSFRRLYS